MSRGDFISKAQTFFKQKREVYYTKNAMLYVPSFLNTINRINSETSVFEVGLLLFG